MTSTNQLIAESRARQIKALEADGWTLQKEWLIDQGEILGVSPRAVHERFRRGTLGYTLERRQLSARTVLVRRVT